ncbi:hypothetical protein MRS76_21320 [Rhizobiaceae bacterium n13]|uniref:Uncharacterized protein n=1 Tax=Ferirhizobium litorale TaxID=2927786 RepID=A0AAE3QJN7_9HYPH|nr:hypothetical protein [Fererhizobium litorale]MDI7864479.1 hypothetical protein [Fererhizobium litorale]MDI7924770.1 hypothetical protein [Fererhizobium litorale]
MSDTKKPDPNSPIPSAEKLRMNILERQLADMDREDKLKEAQRKEHTKFADEFFKKHVSDEERAIIQRVVMRAVNEGKMEALVYSFPSDFCTDSGRAINNADPDWPSTLQGKAKELYDRFKEVAQPQGYHLKAMVISFPGGVPGDIGFYLSWEPPVA